MTTHTDAAGSAGRLRRTREATSPETLICAHCQAPGGTRCTTPKGRPGAPHVPRQIAAKLMDQWGVSALEASMVLPVWEGEVSQVTSTREGRYCPILTIAHRTKRSGRYRGSSEYVTVSLLSADGASPWRGHTSEHSASVQVPTSLLAEIVELHDAAQTDEALMTGLGALLSQHHCVQARFNLCSLNTDPHVEEHGEHTLAAELFAVYPRDGMNRVAPAHPDGRYRIGETDEPSPGAWPRDALAAALAGDLTEMWPHLLSAP